MNKIIFFLIGIIFFSSCTRFYLLKPNVNKAKYASSLDKHWYNLSKQFHMVVHHDGKMYEINNPRLTEETNILTSDFKTFEGKPLYYYEKIVATESHSGLRKVGDGKSVTKQLHFLLQNVTFEGETLSFNVKDIQQVDLTDQKSGANVGVTLAIVVPSVVVGVVGVVGGLIYLACGCPHVYVNDGSGLKLTNTLFTGAQSEQLERFDYKTLPDFNVDSSNYSIRIVNELNEDQFTNSVEMMTIFHPKEMNVITDTKGQLHTIEAPQTALSAKDIKGGNVLDKVSSKDDEAFRFDTDSLADLSELYVNFEGPKTMSNGKLVLRIKNTKWSGYVYNEFSSLFGENFEKWQAMNKDKSKEDKEAWMRQEGIKLLVDIKTETGWKTVDELDLTGDAAFNDRVVELKGLNPGAVELRVRSGFMFWELDYVAMDYSADKVVQVEITKPISALASDGKDYTAALSLDDKNYMSHLNDHASTNVTFNIPTAPTGMERTIVLRSKGYYVSKETYTGKTQRKRLMKFKKPGELSRFSKELFDQIPKSLLVN